MKKIIFSISILVVSTFFSVSLSAQGDTCAEMQPFCSDFGAAFSAGTTGNAEFGNQYGCLGINGLQQPGPAWYYLKIDAPGDLEITLTNSNDIDIDFIVYGPYADLQEARSRCGSFQAQPTFCPASGVCPNGVPCGNADADDICVNGDGVDCSFTTDSQEVANIPNAQVGDVYVFLITNFDAPMPTDIFVEQSGGVAGTDCSIIACRDVSFGQINPDDPEDLLNLPATIDCTDAPIELAALSGTIPETNGFITPAFGIHITPIDGSVPFQNSLYVFDGPNGMGDTLAYWAPNDMGGPYQSQVGDDNDPVDGTFIAFGEYLVPTPLATYSFIWCDNQQTDFFQYEVFDYALDNPPGNTLAMGNFNNNNQECFTVNVGAPSGTATFTGEGIDDTGTGRATFDPAGLEPGTYEITYSWDDGDNCDGFQTQSIEVTCTSSCNVSGGQVQTNPLIELCFDEDGDGSESFILTTINEIYDPANSLTEVLWSVWVLEDPLGVTIAPDGGPIPNDQLHSDDPNYIGLWNNGPGQFISGNTVELIPDGSGVIYYIAPIIGTPSGTFDQTCTGLDPMQGYTIFMNAALDANVSANDCTIQVDLLGGLPATDDTADYSWSYTTPDGQTVTGTGTPIDVASDIDGDYTFSITDDGLGCDLLNFVTVTLNGCEIDCQADAGTFAVNSTTVCYDNVFEIISAGDYAGSYEGGTFDDVADGDGDFHNGVGYAVFSQLPSGAYLENDPNYIGLIGSSPAAPGGANQLATLSINTVIDPFGAAVPILPNTTYYFTTIYGFDVANPDGSITTGVSTTGGAIDCFDSNADQAIAVTFLDSISIVSINQVCNGNGGVDISFQFTGGHPSFNGSDYIITGNGPNQTLPPNGTYVIPDYAPETDYAVVVGDEGGQGCTRTFTGTSISLPIAEMTSTPADCAGNATGTATVTPGSGSGSYSFMWSNGGMTSTISNLLPGTYTVTVTDDLGCSDTGEAIVGQPIGDLSVVAEADSVLCEGGSDGSITAMPSGGTGMYTYQWSGSLAESQTLGGLEAGTYSVTVLDSEGCEATASATVEEPPSLGVSLANETDPFCFGESTGSMDAVAMGGTPPLSFIWSNGEMTTGISDLPPDFYEVTVIDANGCEATASTTLFNPPLLELDIDAVDVIPASCIGSMDGEISTTTAGGIGDYSYTWSHNGGLNAPVASGLDPGSYAVTVTDMNGCTDTDDGFVPSTVMVDDDGAKTDVLCNGESTGTITVNPSGSPNLPYSYTWSANANTGNSPTATGLAAGDYTVTITDAAGCSTSSLYVVDQPIELIIGHIVDNDVLCFTEENGQATVNVSGGTPDALGEYNYLWSESANDQTTATATNLPAGTHTVTVTDENGCEITDEVEIIEPTDLIVGTNATSVSCAGADDATITAVVMGGTPDAAGNYDYQWSANAGGQTTAMIFNLSPGTYSVTVTDANGCVKVSGFSTVTEPDELLANTAVDNQVSCNGGDDGQATAIGIGGTLDPFDPTSDYTYQWDANAGNQITATATNLSAGMYTVTVTDIRGCEAIATVPIEEPDPVSVDIVIDNPVNCDGGSDAQVTATASGGTPDPFGNYTYQWDANASNQNSPTAIGLSVGTYTITVTDFNGCIGTASIEIMEPDELILTVTDDLDVSCFGGNDGAATAIPSGGTPDVNGNYMYQWSASAGGLVTANVTTLPAGMHTVTVTDAGGCTVTGEVEIDEPDELIAVIDLVNDVNCESGNDGAATANPTGGTPNAAGNYTYQWSVSAGFQTNQLANNLPTGTHTVTVTDDNGCIATGEIDITEPTALELTISVDLDVSCGGGTDGEATAMPSGGTPDALSEYTYQWSASADNQITATAINLSAMTHTVTVTDDNGCEITGEVPVSEPPVLSVDIVLGNNVNCGGDMDGEATAVPAGGTPDALGNYTYQWSASANDQITATASGLTATTHTVTVTDANGCTAISSIEITEPIPVATTFDIMPVSCNGGMDGSATANPSGGTPNPDGTYNYQWSNNAGGVFTQTASELSADVYTVTITDANSCSITVTITIEEPPTPLTLVISDDQPSCNGGTDGSITVDPTGGTPSYIYQWSVSANSQITQTALNITAGTHSVTVTDLNGCIEIATIDVGEPEALDLTLIATDPACFGELTGSIAAAVTGGTMPYTYEWNDGQMTEIADSLPQGNHSVIVTDANGCTITDNLTLEEPLEIVLEINTQITSCIGLCDGVASVQASGGEGSFTYEWSNGEITDTVNDLCADVHTVTVTDEMGCAVVDTFTILPPMPIIPGGPGASPVSCHGGNDGSITIEPTGGTPNYSYEWFANDTLIGTDSGTSSSIDSLGEGMYELIITDANGCEMGPINITVVEPSAPLDLTISGEGPSCNGGSDGFVTVEPEGGTTSYSYQWSAETGFQDTQTALNLIPGTYTVTVSDANGCIETAGVTIDEPSAVDFGLSSLPTTCFGDDNGVVIVENPIGGVPPYMYSDDNEIFGMNDTLFGFEAGLHTIYVQDASLCVYTNEVLVEQPFEFIVDAGPDIDILFGDTIELMAQINQPPGTDVTFTWSPDEWLSCIDCDTIYAWPHEDIIYTVTASIPAVDTTETCEARDEIRINVNNDRNIFIPNVFSPDGDGTNDIFMVFGGQGVVEVLSFRVYDRWGELLFEDSNFTTNDPSHGWDGTFRSRDMNPGVYVFAAEVMFLDGARIPYSGDLTLIR